MGARASSCMRSVESEREVADASSGVQGTTIRSPRTWNDEQSCVMMKFVGARINSFLLDEETGVLQPVASCSRNAGVKIFRSCITAEESSPRPVEVKQPVLANSHQHEVEAQSAASNLNLERSDAMPATVEKGSWLPGLSHVSRKPARPSDAIDHQSNVGSDAQGKSALEQVVPNLDLSALPRKAYQSSDLTHLAVQEQDITVPQKYQVYLGNGKPEAALPEREFTEQEEVVNSDGMRFDNCVPGHDYPETKASSGQTTFQSIQDEIHEAVTEQQTSTVMPLSHEKRQFPDISRCSPAPIQEHTWIVVGGGDVGGIKVRKSEHRASKELARLETGSRIRQIELTGERLSYQLIEGHGPEFGWVSIRMKGKILVEPD